MRQWEIKDTGQSIPVTTHAREHPSDNEVPHIVIANGFVGGTFADDFAVRLQDAMDGHMDVSTYQEPYVGRDGYADSYRAEMLDKVVRSIGGRVLVLAHSRGMVAWTSAGPELLQDELVEGLAGLTPIGTSDLPEISAVNLAIRLGTEISHPPLDTLDTAMRTLKMVRHILERYRHPFAATEEIVRTLRTDTSASTITTSHAIPTVMIVGSHDRLVPPDEVRSRLGVDSGYDGGIVEIPSTHAGAFVDARHARVIATAISDLRPDIHSAR